MRFKLGELFCGAGGLAYGAITATIEDKGYRIIHQWAVDYDKDSCDTYIHNICPDNPSSVICKDVRELDFDTLSDIDALAFGFPCNDYSIIGKCAGINGAFGSLYSYGIEALKRFKPIWFLAENVGGIRSADDGRALPKILGDMRDAGYIITPHLYKFEEYGVPQARHRVIIVGIREGEAIKYRVPSPEPYAGIDNTCRTAIENPPIPQWASNNELTRHSATVVRRLQYIKPGENVFNADIPEDLSLNVTGAKMSQTYKRLNPDKPAYTITGSGGGGSHVYHWCEPRALTNRERARLQTFPDTYIFYGSKESVRRQIGMAVPCRGAKIIFEAILRSFTCIEYPWVEANLNKYGGMSA